MSSTPFTDATLQDSTPTPALQEMQAYLEHDAPQGGGSSSSGHPGREDLGACMAVRLAALGATPQVDHLVGALMNWDRRAATIEKAVSVSLLALDDYGRGYLKPDGFAELGLEELLAARHAEMRPTIITSNWTAAQLAKRLSPRLVDRLRECAKIVQLSGPSLRS